MEGFRQSAPQGPESLVSSFLVFSFEPLGQLSVRRLRGKEISRGCFLVHWLKSHRSFQKPDSFSPGIPEVLQDPDPLENYSSDFLSFWTSLTRHGVCFSSGTPPKWLVFLFS